MSRNGMPEIEMVPPTIPKKCALCQGHKVVSVVRVTNGEMEIHRYPCPRCVPEWWRDNPESPMCGDGR